MTISSISLAFQKCKNDSSKISACFAIEFNIFNEFFFVLSPATVKVIKAGLFSFLQFLKAKLIGDIVIKIFPAFVSKYLDLYVHLHMSLQL